jgi:hypothetical protein
MYVGCESERQTGPCASSLLLSVLLFAIGSAPNAVAVAAAYDKGKEGAQGGRPWCLVL